MTEAVATPKVLVIDDEPNIRELVQVARRKLDPLGPPLIHTQRGVGYTLRAQ